MTSRPQDAWPPETARIVEELAAAAPRGLFMTGIEGSDPVVDGVRRNQLLEADNFYENWERRIDNVRGLGIGAIRFGEGYSRAHRGPADYDFRLTDKVMRKCGGLGMEVMANLMHFGLPDWLHARNPGQPYYQNARFPEHFAAFAGEYARRYPAVRYFTVINEPTTTAELSARFGLWNEQLRGRDWRDDRAYVRAAANIARAVILAREEIRRVWREEARPGAPLFFQNEALEKAVAAERSGREAEAERFNLRRFVTLDLILGRRDPEMRGYLLSQGLPEAELDWFAANGGAAGTVLGVDYYLWGVTSLEIDGERPTPPLVPSKFVDTPYALRELVEAYWRRHPLPVMHMEVNGWPEVAVETCDLTYDALRRLRRDGYPVVGMSWFGDELQVGWHNVLSGPGGMEETPVGLFYKGRPQPVAARFRELMRQGL